MDYSENGITGSKLYFILLTTYLQVIWKDYEGFGLQEHVTQRRKKSAQVNPLLPNNFCLHFFC